MTASVEGRPSSISYVNLEANFIQDAKLLLAWIVFFAVVTPLIQRLILWVCADCVLSRLIFLFLRVAHCQETY